MFRAASCIDLTPKNVYFHGAQVEIHFETKKKWSASQNF